MTNELRTIVDRKNLSVCAIDEPRYIGLYDQFSDTIFLNYELLKKVPVDRVLAHELIHWTGHPNRLNRITLIRYDVNYNRVREEIIAEYGALFLLRHCNALTKANEEHIRKTIEQFSKELAVPSLTIPSCIEHARKAVEYILKF